jgi:xylulokinase
MGCMLSAASCNKWLCENILNTNDYAAEQATISPDKLGRNRVFFLPYLMGERSPINDTDARGTFIGLSMDTTRADLVQAVLEGVAFAIRDSVEAAKAMGQTISESYLCGGGARSPLWQTIFTNVLGLPLLLPSAEEGPGFGAALLALVGCGRYPDVATCTKALTGIRGTVTPDAELTARYEECYRKFRAIYPSVKTLFQQIK